MDELYRYSERVVRAAIERLPDGRYEAEDVLEPVDGVLVLRAAVTIAGDEITIDFKGTSPQHEGNLNCPLAVTRSACYFVVRCLAEPDLPSSGGAYAPVHVTAPEGSVSTRWRRLRSSPGTRRRRAVSSTLSSPLSARRSRCRLRVRGR